MLLDSVRAALASRSQTLLPSLHAEGTDCYRLFHGATEGEPGCTLERFGDLLLWQTFRDPPDMDPQELLPRLRDLVEDETGVPLQAVHWNARQKRQRSREGVLVPPGAPLLAAEHVGSEIGLKYRIDVRPPGRISKPLRDPSRSLLGASLQVPPPGRDPNLYLDFRAARRWLAANSEGRDVLNAFAFTCGHRRDDAIDSSR